MSSAVLCKRAKFMPSVLQTCYISRWSYCLWLLISLHWNQSYKMWRRTKGSSHIPIVGLPRLPCSYRARSIRRLWNLAVALLIWSPQRPTHKLQWEKMWQLSYLPIASTFFALFSEVSALTGIFAVGLKTCREGPVLKSSNRYCRPVTNPLTKELIELTLVLIGLQSLVWDLEKWIRLES